MLQEASARTLFVPLYFGHGVTDVPGQEGKFPYIAMEHIQGKTLKDVLKSTDIQGCLDILKTVARGVDELLGDGSVVPIISTDLKPSNIMIRDSNNRPVLIDFDAAKREGELTHSEKQAKSLMYAGPEMVHENSTIRRELNTWQLGAIAFEMLTHQPFFNIEPPAMVYRYSYKDAFDEFLQKRLNEVGLPSATRKVLAQA